MELVKSHIASIDQKSISQDLQDKFDLSYTNNDSDYFKAIYQSLGIKYPKFYKMDMLSKLCFLTGEMLLEKVNLNTCQSEDIAILIANKSSSIDADLQHHESIADKENYLPSPSVFVYTLPNIMIGELCIRHNIMGNCECFLMEEYDNHFFHKYIYQLFQENECKACISGWVNYEKGDFSSELFLIEEKSYATGFIKEFND